MSQILQSLEQQGDIAYFDGIEWDDDGYLEIEYVSTDGDQRKVDVDPITGEIRKLTRRTPGPSG